MQFTGIELLPDCINHLKNLGGIFRYPGAAAAFHREKNNSAFFPGNQIDKV
jgi:hypothetical protein